MCQINYYHCHCCLYSVPLAHYYDYETYHSTTETTVVLTGNSGTATILKSALSITCPIVLFPTEFIWTVTVFGPVLLNVT